MYDKQEQEKNIRKEEIMKTEFDNIINSKIAKDDNKAVLITFCMISFGLFYTYYFCMSDKPNTNINN
jgi:hypothetical protein